MPDLHLLKSWPHLFEPTRLGTKKHDLRNADRNFQVGDMVCLQEYDPATQTYSGRQLIMNISYITSPANPCALSDNGLNANYCILSLEP